MTEENSQHNPFKGLIGSQNPTSPNLSTDGTMSDPNNINTYDQTVNSLIENVFLFTVRRTPPKGKQFIFLEDISSSVPNELISLDFLEHALFERLLLPNPSDFLIPNNERTADNVAEKLILTYLFKSFCRNERLRNASSSIVTDTCTKISELIFRNITTAVKQPELFEGQSLSGQWLDVFRSTDTDGDDDFELKVAFVKAAAKTIYFDDEVNGMDALKSVFYPMFHDVMKRIHGSSLTSLAKWIVPFLRCFAQDKTNVKLAELILDYSTPNPSE